MTTWHGPAPLERPLGWVDWIRVVCRGLPLAILVFGGLALLLVVRVIERPIWGLHRPLTPVITQTVCRGALWIIGLSLECRGDAVTGPGAIVANHASWLDIFALNAVGKVYFVSKAEVAGWPGIGWLARATGTVFIERDRRQARAHTALLSDRLAAGHRLLFFPEGTSTDGKRILDFKTTLFAPFLTDHFKNDFQVIPYTIVYTAHTSQDPRFYGWWGDMAFGPHLLKVLAAPRQGRVTILRQAPLRVADFEDRKSLAKAAETIVRQGFQQLTNAAMRA